MLNEKIKYCRKPIGDLFEETENKFKEKADRKPRQCISQLASDCLGPFKTTKEERICKNCMVIIRRMA